MKTVDEIKQFLSDKFPGQKVSFIGSGSDSVAFKVGTRIFRFSFRGSAIYQKEAAICDYIRPYISVPIPKIEVNPDSNPPYAAHEMIMGEKWSWHKYSWHPRRQKNLARSYAEFMAQLHSVDITGLTKAVPQLRENAPYIEFKKVEKYFAPYLSQRQIKFFEKHYNRIVNAPIATKDMVLVHLGVKGVNSVVDANGNLCGVFDFCNCGIYERSRDFVLMSLSRNRALYRDFRKHYNRISGIKISRARVTDLKAIEFLWEKRWVCDGVMYPMSGRFFKKNIATALVRFHKLPRFFEWFVFAQMSIRARLRKGS